MRTQVKRAFTLIEILIVVVILGILAAIVIPQFTDASQQANTSSLKSQLQTIRAQVELFRVKNNGTDPDLSADWDDLVTPPAINGVAQMPYLHNAPVNPLTQTSSLGSGFGTAGTGWVWMLNPNGSGVMDVYACDTAGANTGY